MNIRIIILSLLALFATHSHADVKEFMCGVQTKDKEFKEIEGFSVLIESHKEKIEIPNGLGKETTAVMCWRSSLLPQKGDHKVILLGYPFYIIEQSDNPEESRMVAFEYANKSYQIREVKGKLSGNEANQLRSMKLRVVQRENI